MANAIGFIVSRVSFTDGSGTGLRQVGDASRSHTLNVPSPTSLTDHLKQEVQLGTGAKGSLTFTATKQGVGFVAKDIGDYWFERVHLVPKLMNFGNILGTVSKTLYVYNAFKTASRTLNTFANNAGAGVTVPDLPALPVTLPAQHGVQMTVVATTAGVPSFSATLDFGLDVYTLKELVSGNRVIILPFRPELPFVETMEFLTHVMEHLDGTEQRVAQRVHPRLGYQFDILRTFGDEYSRFEMLTYEWQHRIYGMPMWHEPLLLTSAANVGDITIQVNSTANCSLKPGGVCMVHLDETHYTAKTILSMTATSITFASPMDVAYIAGTEVYPIRNAYQDPNLAGVRQTIGAAKVTLKMYAADNVDDIASTAGFSVYNSKVLLDDYNYTETSFTETLSRRIYTNDSITGIFSQTSMWNLFRRSSNKAFLTRDRVRLWQVRQLMYALRGKQVSFYLPTFNNAFQPSRNLSTGQSSLFVDNVGYTRFEQARTGRNIIRVTLSDGTKLVRQILAAAELSSSEEQLTVDSSWPATYTPAQVVAIDFYEKVRFDNDTITFTHNSSLGDCIVSAPVKSVLE